MEIRKKKNILEIESDSKWIIYFDEETKEVKIWDLIVSYPWEYEKSGILLEVKEYSFTKKFKEKYPEFDKPKPDYKLVLERGNNWKIIE